MWLGRESDGKGAIEGFAFCLQESLDRALAGGMEIALVGGMEITPSLAAAAFGKFPGKGLGKLEPPAELAAATTLSEAGCLFVRIVVPGEVFHLGRLSPCLSVPVCRDVAVCRGVRASVSMGVHACVRIYLFIFMGVCIYVSIPETFGEAGRRGGGVGCLPDS